VASARIVRMLRASWIAVFSVAFLATAGICQMDDRLVSAKVKEELLIQSAAKGDTHAQSEILIRAEQGDPQAETALGNNYEYGQWVAKDHAEALRWYRKAAEQGDLGARAILGEMYFDGNGVKRDFVEAAKWYRCPKPAEPVLASCKEVHFKDLPLGARNLLIGMNCKVRTGSNYDYGSAVDLSGKGLPAYQFCCSEAPHGPCGAVVIGKIGGEWKNLTANPGSPGFDTACGGLFVLESQHNGFHDVCLPNLCSTLAPANGEMCLPTIWQFSKGRYGPVARDLANSTQ